MNNPEPLREWYTVERQDAGSGLWMTITSQEIPDAGAALDLMDTHQKRYGTLHKFRCVYHKLVDRPLA